MLLVTNYPAPERVLWLLDEIQHRNWPTFAVVEHYRTHGAKLPN